MVENLTRDAFWNVYRPGCLEHYVLHCYRDDKDFVPELDYIMEIEGEIIGQIIYVRSEIVPAKTKGIRYEDDPEADYFLIKELEEGFLDGITGMYKDPEGYFVCEKNPKEFEKFEASFPHKEKEQFPGQLWNEMI